MFKKTLISLAVASTLGLTGCFDDGQTGANADPDYKISNPGFDGKTWPVFNPLAGALPIPNDLIFDSAQGDGTFGVADSSPPVTTALNELSGASTVAPAVIQFNGQIDPATAVYGQTVFLLELEYASGDPVQGLANAEPPTVAGVPAARVDVVALDGTSAIRLLPLEPLAPRKRYVAVVTKGITDINGDPIISSPSYSNLTDEEQPLGNASLASVRTLINKLWEGTAVAALGIEADSIAVSYSFTTSNDEKVLQYIAEPAAWFADQLGTFLKVSAAKAAIAGGASDYATVNATVTAAVGAFPSPELQAALSPVFDAAPPAGCGGLIGQMAIDCTGIALAGNFGAALPNQSGRSAGDITLNLASTKPVPLVSAPTSSVLTAVGAGPTDVLAVEGTISLPYYLGSSASGIMTESWVADDALATAMNQAFTNIGLSIPQANPAVSTAVNYVFPFPKKKSDVEVPLLALYPSDGNVAGVVIYQHGITTDRSAMLTFGTALAAQGYAVFGIDLPLHGVGAFTAEEQAALADKLLTGAGLPVNDTNRAALIGSQLSLGLLAQLRGAGCTVDADDAIAIQQVMGGACEAQVAGSAASMAGLVSIENTVANAGSTVPGLAPMEANERHFGFYAPVPGTVAPFDYANGAGDSGSMFINLTSFLTSRDNMRQGSVDLMNLSASIPGLTMVNLGGQPFQINPAPDTYFVGHSFGTLTGTPFLAAVNANQTAALNPAEAANDVLAASLLTPGGGIAGMAQNSPAFAPNIYLGLQQAAGLAQGDANLETYFNVFQAALDTVDPINFVDNLNGQAGQILLSQVNGDTVVPNAADEAQWGTPALSGVFNAEIAGQQIPVSINSFNAPLSGTQPMTLGLSNITAYDGANHGTPVSADPAAVFGQMVQETLGLFMAP
ncbi:hypothetical protein [Marinobacter zhejiangensis]|uniref:Alpha/beta hydrolase family protein n=1 Tax=Marinobacter zhejiangensis TaxID=488535 RepID=A0A1I4NJZ1_9GAMM|nr:hypothetical protein [Marinobacter zhejiangensis]SFM15779.1 Alpha/beta hydrolase family protein [Marinobacter zhejiangensis]